MLCWLLVGIQNLFVHDDTVNLDRPRYYDLQARAKICVGANQQYLILKSQLNCSYVLSKELKQWFSKSSVNVLVKALWSECAYTGKRYRIPDLCSVHVYKDTRDIIPL